MMHPLTLSIAVPCAADVDPESDLVRNRVDDAAAAQASVWTRPLFLGVQPFPAELDSAYAGWELLTYSCMANPRPAAIQN